MEISERDAVPGFSRFFVPVFSPSSADLGFSFQPVFIRTAVLHAPR